MPFYFFPTISRITCCIVLGLLCLNGSFAQSIAFTNNDTLSPSSPIFWEACAGSTISFDYSGFPNHPNLVFLRTTQQDSISISVSATNTMGTGNNKSGTLTLTIPNNAISGIISFFRNANHNYTTAQPLVIHSPPLDFATLTTPICAKDQAIPLFGSPNGGTFTADTTLTHTGFITNNQLDATKAKWPSAHTSSLDINVTYSYTAQYLNGAPCAQPKDTIKLLTLYDNRLDRISYQTLTRRVAASKNHFLSLDTNLSDLIESTGPDILCNPPTPNCYPHHFSGAFVTTQDSFLSPLADSLNTVVLEYDNNGCIGTITGTIAIVDTILPPVIVGLPDTLCSTAATIILERDSQLVYRVDTIGDALTGRIITRNSLIGISTVVPAHATAINPNSTVVGQESFDFDPSGLSGVTKVVFIMEYQTISAPRSSFGSSADTSLVMVKDSVLLMSPPSSITVSNLDPTYCENGDTAVLTLSQAAIGAARNEVYVTLSGSPNRTYLANGNLYPKSLYDALDASNGSNDLNLLLTYEADFYGCPLTSPISTFTIKAPLSPSLTKDTLCNNDTLKLLQGSPPPSNVVASFAPLNTNLSPNPITNPNLGEFDPSLATVGGDSIIYTFTDNTTGCTYSDTNLILVQAAPQISLTLDSSTTNTSFCTNENQILLDTTSFQGGTIATLQYSGAGVTGTLFDPSSLFGGMGGDTTLYVTATDSFGCVGKDSALVTIHPLPVVDIAGAFNGITTIFAGGITSDHTYFRNDPDVWINSSPNYNTGLGATINGIGIYQSNGVYYYNPSLVPNNVNLDPIIYNYTDSMSCSNSDTTVIGLQAPPSNAVTVDFTNHAANAPANLWEACIGDSVSFEYDGFSSDPTKVSLRTLAGNSVDVFVHLSNQSAGTNNTFRGTASFVVPSDVASGVVEFYAVITPIYTTTQSLLVNSVIVDFLPQTTPLCATNANIQLYGSPSGGVFMSDSTVTSSGFLSGTTMNATQAGWNYFQHVSSLDVDVSYYYHPSYSNGNSCTDSISTTKTLTFYDNRLHSINFESIVKQTNGNNTRLLTLDSTYSNNIITSIIPNISCNSTSGSCYPYTFSGTYVDQNNNFLGNLASVDTVNPVLLEFDNNGCIGSIISDIRVTDFSEIYELPDKLCRQSYRAYFNRDPSLPYTNQAINNNGDREVINHIEDIRVVTPNASNILQLFSSPLGAERYAINVYNIPATDSIVVVSILYLNYLMDNRGNRSDTLDSIRITDTIHMVNIPFTSISGLQTYYCANDSIAVFQLSPDRLNIGNSNLRISRYTNNSSYYQSLTSPSFSPSTIYDSLAPSASQDITLDLLYQADYYGCWGNTRASITIKQPLDPTFVADTIYCESNSPVTFTKIEPNGTIGLFTPIPGLDSAGNFNPQLANVGTSTVTYTITDNYGCSYDSVFTITVDPAPVVELTLDNSPLDISLCTNSGIKILQATSPTSGTPIIQGGLGITNGNTFDPNVGIGTYNLVAEVTQASCSGYDTLKVSVLPPPTVDIATAFNGVSSNVGSISTDHTYCKNEPTFAINPSPIPLNSSSIMGLGISYSNGTFLYNPTAIPTGTQVDTVFYTYTDNIGCSTTAYTIIKLDTVPEVHLNQSRDTSFCLNEAAQHLFLLSNPTLGAGIGLYAGMGLDSTTGVFSPNSAGTGNHKAYYHFTDSYGCSNVDSIIITIHNIPTPNFTGDSSQNCISDPNYKLFSLNDTTTGQFYFYGNLIMDSTGILSPALGGTTGTGTQAIHYVYTDALGCTDTLSRNIFIHQGPQILVAGLDSAYCSNAPIDFISLEPQGGTLTTSHPSTFTINGGFLNLNPAISTSGYANFTYTYTDGNNCSDTITTRTYLHHTTQASIPNLDIFYCQANVATPLTGNPVGGTFLGAGVELDNNSGTWQFTPSKAGLGLNSITYSINDSFSTANYTLVCPIDTTVQVNISALPTPLLASPTVNTRFCSNDTLQELVPASLIANSGYYHQFFQDSGGVYLHIDTTLYFDTNNIVRYLIDSSYYFKPDTLGEGIHFVTHVVTDSLGCIDSATTSFIVDAYTEPDFLLDSTFCASADSVALYGYPGGGIFTRNGDTLRGTGSNVPPYFVPSSNISQVTYDTVTYSYSDGACLASKTVPVTTFPIPQLSFSTLHAHNTYCLGGTPVLLSTTDTGTFSGTGVLPGGNYFYPDLAGAGSHAIALSYQNSNSGCSNSFTDTLHVYGMPKLDFAVAGGCQLDSSYFYPNNDTLGLDNVFQNDSIDQITSVLWVVSPTDTIIGTHQRNSIDPVVFSYGSPGIYYPQLIVANRQYCIDTHTIRIVISPTVNAYPYVEDFQNGSGNWFAESRSNAYNLLWEHGTDNNPRGIAADTNNYIWATNTNAPYEKGEQAWVYSPCFDLSSLQRPMLSLDYWSDTRNSVDGTVLEYQRADGTWAPLGLLDRGIGWYNAPFISGQPGDQNASNLAGTGWTAPIGWSGKSWGWENGRYKLDAYRGANNTLRLRIAFGSPAIQLNGFYDGFAFDNVIIKNRNRNVLLETMANKDFIDMELANEHSYQLAFHTSLNKDLVLLQYHMENPSVNDLFYTHNPTLGRNRAYEYAAPAGRAFINGHDPNQTYVTTALVESDFEQDMLEDAKFAINIDTFFHANGHFQIRATTTALAAMDSANYRIYTVISEDSLSYPNGSGYNGQIHAVARENDQFHTNVGVNTNNIFGQSWAPGQSQLVTFDWNHAAQGFINYRPNCFHAVVFIQDIDTKEIFQVATTRDVSGYWVGVEPVEAEEELNELQSLNLFPNPAHDYFHLKFDHALEHEYQWKLVNIQGVEVQTGTIQAGTEQVLVDGLDAPAGTYILLLHNNKVFVQRKVILGRP